MCLISKNINGYVAEDDIVCYKFVRLVGFKDGVAQFGSPFQNCPIKLNDYLVAEGEVDKGYFGDVVQISGGIIHCFQHLRHRGTRNIVDWVGNCTALKCIIPAGEVFYVEDFCEDEDVRIGAKRVFVTDEVIERCLSNGRKDKTIDNVSYHEVGVPYQLRLPFDYAELEKVG